MVNDLRQAVNKLRALAPQLNSAVEEATRVVQVVERFLAQECQLGVEADIPVTYNDKGKAVLMMRYGPVDGAYHIALTHSDGDARFVTCPWLKCDRAEKLASFPALPKLLMAVAKAVEQQITSTSATVATVSQIMSALAQPMGRGEVSTLPDLAILLSSTAEVTPAKAVSNGNGNGRHLERRNPAEKASEKAEEPVLAAARREIAANGAAD